MVGQPSGQCHLVFVGRTPGPQADPQVGHRNFLIFRKAGRGRPAADLGVRPTLKENEVTLGDPAPLRPYR